MTATPPNPSALTAISNKRRYAAAHRSLGLQREGKVRRTGDGGTRDEEYRERGVELVGRSVTEAIVQTGVNDGERGDTGARGVRGGQGGRGRPGQACGEWHVEGDERSPRSSLRQGPEKVKQAPLPTRHGIEFVSEEEAEEEEIERDRHFGRRNVCFCCGRSYREGWAGRSQPTVVIMNAPPNPSLAAGHQQQAAFYRSRRDADVQVLVMALPAPRWTHACARASAAGAHMKCARSELPSRLTAASIVMRRRDDADDARLRRPPPDCGPPLATARARDRRVCGAPVPNFGALPR